MKLTILEDFTLQFEEVFTGIKFLTDKGEHISICMRDSGFEFNYNGKWYSAQQGIIREKNFTRDGTDISSEPNYTNIQPT